MNLLVLFTVQDQILLQLRWKITYQTPLKRKTARASVKTLLFFKWLQQENGQNFPKNSCYGCFKKDPGQLYGRTVCNKVVNFTSQSVDLIGQFINIQIVEALPNSLKGNLK